jgi:hypothetical protein
MADTFNDKILPGLVYTLNLEFKNLDNTSIIFNIENELGLFKYR